MLAWVIGRGTAKGGGEGCRPRACTVRPRRVNDGRRKERPLPSHSLHEDAGSRVGIGSQAWMLRAWTRGIRVHRRGEPYRPRAYEERHDLRVRADVAGRTCVGGHARHDVDEPARRRIWGSRRRGSGRLDGSLQARNKRSKRRMASDWWPQTAASRPRRGRRARRRAGGRGGLRRPGDRAKTWVKTSFSKAAKVGFVEGQGQRIRTWNVTLVIRAGGPTPRLRDVALVVVDAGDSGCDGRASPR